MRDVLAAPAWTRDEILDDALRRYAKAPRPGREPCRERCRVIPGVVVSICDAEGKLICYLSLTPEGDLPPFASGAPRPPRLADTDDLEA